jgi:hypothetical protein
VTGWAVAHPEISGKRPFSTVATATVICSTYVPDIFAWWPTLTAHPSYALIPGRGGDFIYVCILCIDHVIDLADVQSSTGLPGDVSLYVYVTYESL